MKIFENEEKLAKRTTKTTEMPVRTRKVVVVVPRVEQFGGLDDAV